MRDGILVLNKEQNWTSSDCVAICRRILGAKGIKKVGHGGTLDPMATGVLPIFVGQATRIMEYMDIGSKTYICEAKLGITTDTLDIWGEIIGEVPWNTIKKEKSITKDKILHVLRSFEGEIKQVPPKYSAVRINGKRLYEYAHNGQEIEIDVSPRNAYVKRLSALEINIDEGTISFEIECSKGTYVRAICSDLGEKLGCGCTMTALERTAVGNIGINQAMITPNGVKEMDAYSLEKLMISSDYPLISLGKVTMSSDRVFYFSRGNSIRWKQINMCERPDTKSILESGGGSEKGQMPKNARGKYYDQIYRVYEEETGDFLGTGYHDLKTDELKADKVFIKQRNKNENI